MPRKPQTLPVEYSVGQKAILWIKTKPVHSIITLLFGIAIVLAIIAIYKTPTKEPVVEPPQQITTVNPTNALEIQLEKQSVLIQKLETENNNLENNLKLLEKRLQAHTDIMKRMCEYIIVITVDKKIIPRQCLPEYKWSREENGN